MKATDSIQDFSMPINADHFGLFFALSLSLSLSNILLNILR